MYNKVELCGVDTAQLPVLSETEKRQLLTRARAGDAAARQADLTFGPDDLVVLGTPTYAGRVPNVLLPYLTGRVRGSATPAARCCSALWRSPSARRERAWPPLRFSIPCVCRGSSPERTATGTTTCPA